MKKKDISFIIFIFIIELVFSMLFPVYQTPDEMAHLQMIYTDMNQSIVVDELYGDFADTTRIIGNYDQKVDIDKYFNTDHKLKNNLKLTLPRLLIIRHLPQSFGILIGHFLELPALFALFLAEFFAICFYAIACAIVLKILPIKKEIMKFIMLLPIVIQQMGSLSYDVVLISLSFIFIAYIMHLKFKKEKITIIDLLIISLLLSSIMCTKIPYILLGLLLIVLPIDKINILGFNKEKIFKYKKILIILFILIMIIVSVIALNTSYGRTIIAFFTHPIELFKILFFTIKSHGTGFAYTLVGNFGWLDTPVSIIYCLFVAVLGFIITFMITNDEKNNKFSRIDKILLFGIFIFIFIILILSLFEWTITMNGINDFSKWSFKTTVNFIKNNIIVIDGIQGRYFVPILPLLCFSFSSSKITGFVNKIHPNVIKIIGFSVVILYMFIIILSRYWI